MNMRILLFGDDPGVSQLLRHIPSTSVVGIIAAANRPQYHKPLSETAKSISAPFTIQPLPHDKSYAAFRQWITDRSPDLIWVNSYSMIVREDILVVPRLGGINIHSALLPQYRGCNPTQWAILNSEHKTGVTLHEMSAGIDEGRIIDQRFISLRFEDTWKDVHGRIIIATDELIADNFPTILTGRWTAVAQDSRLARYHRRRTPEDGQFDWDTPVIAIYNLIRALVKPLPGAFYLDERGNKVICDYFMSLAEIVYLKYRSGDEEAMMSSQVCLKPLDTTINSFNTPSDWVPFGVEDRRSRELVGTCQLLNIDGNRRSAELRIAIDGASSQKAGFEAETTGLLVNFGFQELGLDRIFLHVPAVSQDAIGVYESIGFKKQEILQHTETTDENTANSIVMFKLRSNV